MDALPDVEIVVSMCVGLIMIDSESCTVRLICTVGVFRPDHFDVDVHL